MGGTSKSTIHLEKYGEDGVCAIYGGPVGWSQGVECVGTRELDREQAHAGSREGGSTRNLNGSGLKNKKQRSCLYPKAWKLYLL